MINVPYMNTNQQWVVDLQDGSRLGPFVSKSEALSAMSDLAVSSENTAFVIWLAAKIRELYSIQADILMGEHTFSEKNCKPLVIAAMMQKAQVDAQNAAITAANSADPDGPQAPLLPEVAIPSKFADFTTLLEDANFAAIPNMDAPKFRVVMDKVNETMTSVPDEISMVLYQVVRLPGA